MKETFSHKILDWTLIGLTLIFSIIALLNPINEIEFFSSYLLRIVFTLVSITAFLALLISQLNGERFSRIFIVVILIIPAVIILNQFLTDLIFYGTTRMVLLQNPILFLQLITGIFLLYLTTIYSKQEKTEHIKDYGILIIGIGVFAICYPLARTISLEYTSYPIWKTIIKSIIGIGTLITGNRLKNGKIKLNKGLIFTLIFMFVYGLI